MKAKLAKVMANLALLTVCVHANGTSVNEKVAEMMNKAQWFELREFMQTPNDSIVPFLYNYAHVMLAHSCNKTEKAVALAQNILNSGELDLDNVLGLGSLMASDLSKLGKNEEASAALTQILEATRQHLDSAAIADYSNQINKYKTLSAYRPYSISRRRPTTSIPLRIDSVFVHGVQEPKVFPYLTGCKLNGVSHDVLFDTGAGRNVISPRLARQMNLKFLNAAETVVGTRVLEDVPMAIADSIEMEDVTVYDVPFIVLDISSGQDSLDQYLKNIELIVGMELMDALKHVKLDFANACLSISDTSYVPESEETNMMLPMTVRCTVNDHPLLVTFDSGDSSHGIFYGRSWPYMKSFVSDGSQPQSALAYGAGGFDEISLHVIKGVPLTIGSQTVAIPYIILSETYGVEHPCDARMGIKTLMLNKSILFDRERMVMAVEN